MGTFKVTENAQAIATHLGWFGYDEQKHAVYCFPGRGFVWVGANRITRQLFVFGFSGKNMATRSVIKQVERLGRIEDCDDIVADMTNPRLGYVLRRRFGYEYNDEGMLVKGVS